ncbi:MAG: hypothetical protein F4107_00185 [Gemmatimonadetes bacterium]|nr:hypothetical protein [Gemmatimonadota bacterium]MYD12241.1 hypothetical protein [Gemmatimonadota bacterium]MYI64345.1 hypothetical protein [Gemmatimonadota bacterium]
MQPTISPSGVMFATPGGNGVGKGWRVVIRVAARRRMSVRCPSGGFGFLLETGPARSTDANCKENMTFRKSPFTFGNPRTSDHSILYFDFVDPISHLASRMVDRAGVAAAIEWRGLELCPPPQPMIDPGAAGWRARQTLAAGHARRRADNGPGPPPIIPWTRKAHELCEFARERDCLDAVRRALFRAHFVDHTDIGRIDLLVEIARAAGLDRSEAKAVLDVDRFAGAVLENRSRALDEGIADVPALVHPGGLLEGPEVLGEIERALAEMKATTQSNNREE